MNTQNNWLALILAALSLTSLAARAQGTQASMPGMDHSRMDHGAMTAAPATMPAEAMPAMDHSRMNHGAMTAEPAAMPAESMPGMDHKARGDMPSDGNAGMDHGDMKAQGGNAPADARDPHAYSGGYTLDQGPDALPGARLLKLADEHSFGSVLFDRLEHVRGRDAGSTAYDAQAWYGRDYDKLVIKAEGEVAAGRLQDARTELLWGHAVAPYWDTQLGLRHDSGVGPARDWLAFGIQGLAPYWFEVGATAYLGGNGRTALRLGAEYDVLLTQKLILQPRAEFSLYGKDDVAREIGSGLSNGVIGLRLRYEINRQLAPYIGVERSRKFGQTADLARAGGERTAETRWVAGVRFWF
ncbi:MAG: copper resistance protein B [Pseudomonadota bacterium]